MPKKNEANSEKYQVAIAFDDRIHKEVESLQRKLNLLRTANTKLQVENAAGKLREQFFRKTHFARETGVIVLTACGLYAPFLTDDWRVIYYGVIASAVTSYILGTWFSRIRLENDE